DLDPAAPEGPARQVARFVTRSDGLAFLASRDRWTGLMRPSLTVDAVRPTASEQRDGWHERLTDLHVEPGHSDAAANALAGQFRLDLPEIDGIARSVVDDLGPGPRS